MFYLALALLAGAPALVYQVVWTREVGLLVGSQIEATSIVLAAFFGGLALGARLFGRLGDSSVNPLRLYAALEGGAGVLAVVSLLCLRALGSSSWISLPLSALLPLTAALLLPTSLLLGGTLPVLLRAAESRADRAARSAGGLVGSNTAGAIAGVIAATTAIPQIGLRATLLIAAAGSVALGVMAFALTLQGSRRDRVDTATRERATPAQPAAPVPLATLAAAALAGVATLGYEVLSGRMAAIRLGSSLYAWALVLSCVLGGLALGNLLTAARAARSDNAARELGWIEVFAAVAVAAGVGVLSQSPAIPSPGLTQSGLLAVVLGIGPAALLMGAGFPYFVRLAIGRSDDDSIGGGFGAISGANTAGGVVGSLLAPFALIPLFGVTRGALACAGINAALGIALLFAGARAMPEARRSRWRLPLAARWGAQALLVVVLVSVASLPGLAPPPLPAGTRIDFVADGRQATAAVARLAERRDMIVDGDPEASTGGAARATEELLAVLPLLLHPEPRLLLEVGLGSGITLGMASNFPLERLECVEIADSVIAAARFFEPDNQGVASGADPRLRITHSDGRAYLARHRNEYDVAIANTLHPWAIGATGLYSREYFTRLAGSLRPNGIVVQWLPIDRIGADHLAAILRTFFAVFPEGALWWGDGNVIAVGSLQALPELDSARFGDLPPVASQALARMGITRPADLLERRLASAAALRDAIGAGEVLGDDRPVLEARGARRRSPASKPGAPEESEIELVRNIARAGAPSNSRARELLLWLDSLVLREAGDTATADTKEREAETAGLGLAQRARGLRLISHGASALERNLADTARFLLHRGLEAVPDEPSGLFGLAAIARNHGDLPTARRHVERLTTAHPHYARGMNLLGVVLQETGDSRGAREAFERALALDPNFREPLANAGLLAVAVGDDATALRHFARLERLDPGTVSAERQALGEALFGRPNRSR